jgi:serine phosphatase RsbU (regulator of sigma subunit)
MISNFYRILSLNSQKELAQQQILKRNLEMEKDILMARKIQNQLIPEKSPKDCIAFLYKPMEQVGGDFFDFLEFREQNSIGIFVSDVSGHGVPAAFITSMIKSAISQTRDQQENPAYLLSSLNKSLFNQTGGNFVTAFYGIYKMESRKFIYANAGHNLPLIIQNNKMTLLETKNRSIPLGVMDNQEMLVNNLTYSNHTIQLESGSKLILYTDGLTETVPLDSEKPDFETSLMEQAFLNNSSKPAKAFVNEIYRILVDFHGSDNFSDDVCLICLDVN